MAASTPLTLAQAITASREAYEAVKAKSNSQRKRKGSCSRNDDDVDAASPSSFVSPLPRNPTEQKEWDRMSTRMNMFHDHFRQTFARVWQMSEKVTPHELQEYLDYAEEFIHHLEGHHGIEERYIFPVLAKKMPEFRIHAGMERYQNYIRAARHTPTAFRPEKMQEIMASMGPILFYHLDAEVETLKADNLRRYYTLDEVRRLPM
ncbi:BQ2448_1250 [Microbotryum intermedium]|uniref:BQ2448_1250 protein n=1 Tax=Microbotryum intermedium TaxID=269621 RepID=A0A238FFI8_9BASI|nr:BQ2448_1250 [Microbotryum intermedium]